MLFSLSSIPHTLEFLMYLIDETKMHSLNFLEIVLLIKVIQSTFCELKAFQSLHQKLP